MTFLLFTTNTPRVVLNKFLCWEVPSRGPTPYPFIYHFSRKRCLFCIFSIGTNDSYHWYQWTPFLSPLTPVESICEYWTTLALVRVLSKCLCGEAPPRGPTPYPFIYHFSRKRYLFRIPFIDKWYPFHIPCLELCIPFNCCNALSFK